MKTEKKECYGKISISKFQSNGCTFFGSDIVHNGGISIEISDAYIDRSHSKNYIGSNKNLIKIRMSHNQFVDLITSAMNTDGVPCTIDHMYGKKIEQINHVKDKKEEYIADLKNTFDGLLSRIDIISSKIPKNISNKAKNELEHEIAILKSHLVGNTKYVFKTFNEEMEKTMTEAKTSFANYISDKVEKLGIDNINKETINNFKFLNNTDQKNEN